MSTSVIDGAVAVSPRASVAIEARGVGQMFRSTRVLDDVSFSVAAGEVHALLGPNGAGKTTLLRALMGLLDPTEGSVRVLGDEAKRRSPTLRGRIGFIPSGDRSLYLRISGRENLRFFARMQGLRKGDAVRRANELLQAVDLMDAADRPVRSYSHGMQKRLSVARALIREPEVLLVDEATHDLDPDNAERVRDLVRAVALRGAAVIWTTQRIEEIQGLADHATVLNRGRVLFSGTTANFTARADPRRYLLRLEGDVDDGVLSHLVEGIGIIRSMPGDAGMYVMELAEGRAIGEAVLALAAGSVRVMACSQERPSIETAFLDITRSDDL